ncbi:MAG: nucleotidyltransferase domain-containing protein [Candidatus Diapherotrites archaeon]
MASIQGNTKRREFFPKKGIKRNFLMFIPELMRAPGNKSSIIKRFLLRKSPEERKRVRELFKVFLTRKPVIDKLKFFVEEKRKSIPGFEGLIVFGGFAKKEYKPSEVDLFVVGNMPISERKGMNKEIAFLLNRKIDLQTFNEERGKVIVNSLSSGNAERFFRFVLFNPGIIGISFPDEWSVQNFIGPLEIKRKLKKAFEKVHKELKLRKKRNQ